MAKKQTPKIASPGATAKKKDAGKAVAAPKKGAAAAAAATAGETEAAKTMIAHLGNKDIDTLDKWLRKYKAKRAEHRKALDEAKSINGEANALKKEMVDAGWHPKALALAFKLAEMEPEDMQRMLGQIGIIGRRPLLDLPFGASGDLFDSAKGGVSEADPNKAAIAAEGDKGAKAAPKGEQSRTTQLADIFELGRMDAKAGKECVVPRGILATEDKGKADTYKDGWQRGNADRLADGLKKPTASAVAPPPPASTPAAKKKATDRASDYA